MCGEDRRERGQGSAEYVGVLAVAALVVVALASSPVGPLVAGTAQRTVATTTPCSSPESDRRYRVYDPNFGTFWVTPDWLSRWSLAGISRGSRR